MKKTMKQFIEEAGHINPALIRAVVRQSGGWEQFCEMAPNIARHGVDGGFCGLIYYDETLAFTKAHKKLILEHAEQMADDIGETLFGMIAGFGVFRHDPISHEALARAIYTGKGDDVTTVYNVLAWFACEDVARAYDDIMGG